jgi:hypothetical protein
MVVAILYLDLGGSPTLWQKISGVIGARKAPEVTKAMPSAKQPEQTKPDDEDIPFYEPRPSGVGWVIKDPKPPYTIYNQKPEGYVGELDGITGTVEKIEGDVITLINPVVENADDRAANSSRWRIRIDNPAVKVFKFTADFSLGKPWTDGSLADLAPGAKAGFAWARPQGSSSPLILYKIDIDPAEYFE